MEIAAIVFVLVMLGVAYVAFRLLKRVVKMAVRMVIVLLIIAIALVGGTSLWIFGSGSPTAKPPATKKSR